MTHNDFLKTINRLNNLTEKGFGNVHKDENLNNQKTALQNRYEEFRLCCEWIKKFGVEPSEKRLNKIPQTYSSYYLKHLVEKWSGQYISNGAFIAAVIYLNIPYRRIYGTPDISVTLYLKEKNLVAETY